MKTNLLLVLALITLVLTMTILNYVPNKVEKKFNLCDETWFNYRFSTSLPNENIPFRDTMAERYVEECK